MLPTLGTEELHHSRAHTAHPGQRGAAPTAGLTPPTPGRGEWCPQPGSHHPPWAEGSGAHSRAHTTHPGQRGAVPTAGLTPPTEPAPARTSSDSGQGLGWEGQGSSQPAEHARPKETTFHACIVTYPKYVFLQLDDFSLPHTYPACTHSQGH